MQQNNKYYRVYDYQTGRYFATGYNATSMNELIESFSSYINGADDNEQKFETFGEIMDYLQDIDYEESETPFDENDY